MTHHRLKLLACALLALVAGCGPGTGGTGTGLSADRLAQFGALPASVCTAAFADQLTCVTGAQTPDVNQGTLVVHYADIPTGRNVTVDIADNGIELNARCQKLRFVGDWGITASNDARFFGHVTQDQVAQAQPATLSVMSVPQAGADELSVTLRAADGRILFGPVTLQREAVPVAPTAACP